MELGSDYETTGSTDHDPFAWDDDESEEELEEEESEEESDEDLTEE